MNKYHKRGKLNKKKKSIETNKVKIPSTQKLLKNQNVGNLSTSFESIVKKVVYKTIIGSCFIISTSKNIVNKIIAPETF